MAVQSTQDLGLASCGCRLRIPIAITRDVGRHKETDEARALGRAVQNPGGSGGLPRPRNFENLDIKSCILRAYRGKIGQS